MLVDLSAHELCDALQPACVGLVEGLRRGAVDVHHCAHLSPFVGHGDHDFGACEGAAGDVSREFLHMGHELCLLLLPRRSAHAAPLGDAVAGGGALEGSQQQLLAAHEVEACPGEAAVGGVQCRRHVGQDGGLVALAFHQGGYLAV